MTAPGTAVTLQHPRSLVDEVAAIGYVTSSK